MKIRTFISLISFFISFCIALSGCIRTDNPNDPSFSKSENSSTALTSSFQTTYEGTAAETSFEEPKEQDFFGKGTLLYDYSEKFYYQVLDDRQKSIYEDIYFCLENNLDEKYFSLNDVSLDELDYVLKLFIYENPQFYRMDVTEYNYICSKSDGNLLGFSPEYYITENDKADEIGALIEKEASGMVALANSEGSTFGKLLSLHNSLLEALDYERTNENLESSITGAFTQKRAQCQGYAMAYTYLCQLMGITCICITGTANNDGHMWNKVLIDGEWYNIDVTWDDNLSSYDYFCLSDLQISSLDHNPDDWLPLDKCRAVSEKYSGFLEESAFAD